MIAPLMILCSFKNYLLHRVHFWNFCNIKGTVQVTTFSAMLRYWSRTSQKESIIASCGSSVAFLAYDTKLLMRSVNYSIVVVVQQHATVQVHNAAVD